MSPSRPLADIRFAGGTPFATAQERTQALRLIRRLAQTGRPRDTELTLSSIRLAPLGGGRSKARVFEMTRHYGPGRRRLGMPVVVKLAPRLLALHEKKQYDTLVRGALPPACVPDLLGFCGSRDYAALCFSHVAPDGAAGSETLSQALQRGDTLKLARVLRRIIEPLRDSWYSPRQWRAERDLAARYLKRYFTDPRSTFEFEARLRACAARYFNARQHNARCLVGEGSFPMPRSILFDAPGRRRYHSCVLHGDLNSDNIILSGRPPGVAIVDFQKTGRGHVYEDLLHIEASVRINYGGKASFAHILAQERLIAAGKRLATDPYVSAILRIRAAATRCFGDIEAFGNYHYATAAIGLRLMQAVDLTHAARARVTASTLWAAKALAGETESA